jgi:hypothetical protein
MLCGGALDCAHSLTLSVPYYAAREDGAEDEKDEK